MKKERQSGITLVALVVTIVVLLILAGVSINLVLGQNGLITRAKEAREKSSQSEQNDVNEMNNAGDWIDKVVKESKGETSNNNPGQNPGQEETENPGDQTGGTTGNANTITKDDYGKVVTDYTAENKTWEIFYADDTNVYLITRENIGDQTLSIAVSENSGYNGTGDFDGSDSFKTKYPAIQAGWLNKTYTPATSGKGTVNYESSYNNMKCTEYLLDSNVWNKKYKTEKADWVIGAPTLEMLVASYGKYEGKTIAIATPSGNGYAQTIISGLTTSKANGLYNHSYYYWLACPNSEGKNYMRIGNYNNDNVSNDGYSGSNGVRPVVCLKSSVTLTPSDESRSSFTIN